MNINRIVEQCYNRLPNEWQSAPWRYLNHGYDILSTEDQLNAYVASYGEIHIAKCRKAIQNFPFDQLIIKNGKNSVGILQSIEIFDWGCGQGLGVLTFLQFLYERDLLDSVKKIVLVEPSESALKRAEDWVKQAVNAPTQVEVINKKIPSIPSEEWPELAVSSNKKIHIFSNILDVRGVNLTWLAKATTRLGEENYYICVGPQYKRGTSRIEDFFNHFISPVCYTDINLYPCGYTTKTHHPFGIEAKCFKHMRKYGLNVPLALSDQSPIDEYEDNENSLQGVLPDNVNKAYQKLKKGAKGNFELYICPCVGIERPDFVFNSPIRGVIIVNVCEDLTKFDEEYQKLENIKKALFDTYIGSLKINTIINSSFYNGIKTGLYFPTSTQDEVEEACKNYYNLQKEKYEALKQSKEEHSTELISRTDTTKYLLKLFPISCEEVLSRTYAKSYKYDFYLELNKLLMGNWHHYASGDKLLQLTENQKEILENDSRRLRVKGVAGSGKTLLLAHKAVREHLRTGRKVLIVTYNIALIQYIRMRIGQVRADFNTEMFEVINYHEFFWSKAKRFKGKEVNFSSADNPNFFESCKNQIHEQRDKYTTIIVDEVQDFQTEWIECLQKYFLTQDGSLFLFGDGEQNIYNRLLEKEERMPVIRGFSGRWTELTERVSMRLLNQEITRLASDFSRCFGLSDHPLESCSELPLFDYKMKYWCINEIVDVVNLSRNIEWILRRYELNPRDVVVLGQSVDLLREVRHHYQTLYNRRVMTTFESRKEYYEIKNNAGGNKGRLIADIRDVRRVAKVHFTTDVPDLKFATISSFKGWESKTVILIIQKENDVDEMGSPEDQRKRFYIHTHGNENALLYTAITRARENLFIINLGNNKYDDFFKTRIING